MVSSKKVVPGFKKLLSLLIVFSMIIVPSSMFAGAQANEGESTGEGTNYPFVFVSGFAGWGLYEMFNNNYPYWGRLNGSLIDYLKLQGYEKCYDASITPFSSAWDRACELYAQLTGTVVDYGEVHSKVYNHPRFGTDFGKDPNDPNDIYVPLITGWGPTEKVNFIAHSFGGATVRLLAVLMANGDKNEVDGTTSGETSGLFTGGKAEWIHSITALASPHNGTTVTLLTDWSKIGLYKSLSLFIKNNIKINYLLGISNLLSPTQEVKKDTGLYDLSVDGAAELNSRLSPIKNIYYFSVPTDATTALWLFQRRFPDKSAADPALWLTITFMGGKTATTPGGISIDKSWFKNDGVVNTVSTMWPINKEKTSEAHKAFDANNIIPGIWNIMETYKGDHAAIIGGLTRKVDVNAFYMDKIKLINSIAQ